MVRRVHVREHYRNLPRRSRQKSSDSWFFRIIVISVVIFALLYLLSRIPAQVYFAIATTIAALVVCGFLLFISIGIYQHQHQIKLDIENRDSQEYMQQVNFQTQKSQQ